MYLADSVLATAIVTAATAEECAASACAAAAAATEAAEKVKEVTNMISQGAPTPVAGKEGIYVFFESGDLLAFNHEGDRRWGRKLTKEFGQFIGGHGVGSSLVGVPDKLVLLIDHDGPSYLLCVDRLTGKTHWKTPREPRVSWTTPLYLKHDEEEQIISSFHD